MPITPPVPIDAGPALPSSSDGEATFDAAFEAFLSWQKTQLQPQTNALAANVYSNAQAAETAASTAVGARNAAAGSASAANADALRLASLDALWLGSLNADPATGKNGAPLVKGNAYVNSNTGLLRAYTGAAWTTGVNVTAGVASINGMSGDVKWGDNTSLPVLRPTLLLDFVNSRSVDSRITFTRASTATRTNERGLIETVAANVPRIDFDPVTGACKGLLIEEARTNLLTYSEQFDNAAWEKFGTTVTPNLLAAPDGSLTVDKIVENTPNSEHYIRSVAASFTAGTYVASVYWHTSSERNLYLRVTHVGDTNATSQVLFYKSTLTLGAVAGNGVSASAQNAGNGWWRISLVFTITATRNVQHGCQLLSTSVSYAGDGTSGLYIWGAQLEAGSFPTSYIPTTAAQVTRAADVATMTGANFSSWYRQDEGTVFCDAAAMNDGEHVALDIGAGGAFGTTAYISYYSYGDWSLNPDFAPINVFSSVSSAPTAKIAAAIAANNSVLAVNGVVGDVDTNCTPPPSPTQLSIGCGGWSSAVTYLNGHLRRIAYYPKRLTNAELQALTTP